jgi:hypothetical protein
LNSSMSVGWVKALAASSSSSSAATATCIAHRLRARAGRWPVRFFSYAPGPKVGGGGSGAARRQFKTWAGLRVPKWRVERCGEAIDAGSVESRFRFCFKLGSPSGHFRWRAFFPMPEIDYLLHPTQGIGPGRSIYERGVRTATAAGPSRAGAFGSAASCARPELRSNHEVRHFSSVAGTEDPSPVRSVSTGGSRCPLSVSRRMIGVPGHRSARWERLSRVLKHNRRSACACLRPCRSPLASACDLRVVASSDLTNNASAGHATSMTYFPGLLFDLVQVVVPRLSGRLRICDGRHAYGPSIFLSDPASNWVLAAWVRLGPPRADSFPGFAFFLSPVAAEPFVTSASAIEETTA